MKRMILTFLLAVACSALLFGQAGGNGVFSFLQLANSARVNALGGNQVAIPDTDPGLMLANPALLMTPMDNRVSVSYARYLAGIGFGSGAYARDLGKWGMAGISLLFLDYGQFVAADENGRITGSFSASDIAAGLSWAKSLHRLSFGVTLKPVYSHLESYRSFGLAADAGVCLKLPDERTVLAAAVKNAGKQLVTYYDGAATEPVAWSLEAGISRQLQFAPLLLCLTLYDLNHWKNPVSYTDPNGLANENTSNTQLTTLIRHLSAGVEFTPGNRLTFRLGYNYRRRTELSLTDHPGLSGLTAGIGLSLAQFRFNYSLSGYAQNGTVHCITLSARLSRLTGTGQGVIEPGSVSP